MSWLLWRFDMLVYRLFFWRWERRLINDAKLRAMFKAHLNAFEIMRQKEREP